MLVDELLPVFDVSDSLATVAWTLGVGSGAHVLVQGVLEMARALAEEGASRA